MSSQLAFYPSAAAACSVRANDCSPFSCVQRMDLGECPKIHDLALRADYDIAAKKRDYFYDIDVSVVISGT